VALGSQLFQTSSSTPDGGRPSDGDLQRPRSDVSLLADTVVRHTVSRIRDQLSAEGAGTAGAGALERRSTASLLADTVVQQTLREISDGLVTSDLLPTGMLHCCPSA